MWRADMASSSGDMDGELAGAEAALTRTPADAEYDFDDDVLAALCEEEMLAGQALHEPEAQLVERVLGACERAMLAGRDARLVAIAIGEEPGGGGSVTVPPCDTDMVVSADGLSAVSRGFRTRATVGAGVGPREWTSARARLCRAVIRREALGAGHRV